MTNVASLENCKKLWEISGWNLPLTDWTWRSHYPNGQSQLILTIDKLNDEQRYRNQPKEIADRFALENAFYPAYDLGYLLRVLPYCYPDGETKAFLTVSTGSVSAVASYKLTNGESKVFYRADTPENALTLLAIELFEDGILTK